jgi:hypothetical protein
MAASGLTLSGTVTSPALLRGIRANKATAETVTELSSAVVGIRDLKNMKNLKSTNVASIR